MKLFWAGVGLGCLVGMAALLWLGWLLPDEPAEALIHGDEVWSAVYGRAEGAGDGGAQT